MAQSAQPLKRASSSTDAKKGDTAGYWRANLRLIGILLVIWFAVSYLPVLIVRLLNQVTGSLTIRDSRALVHPTDR